MSQTLFLLQPFQRLFSSNRHQWPTYKATNSIEQNKILKNKLILDQLMSILHNCLGCFFIIFSTQPLSCGIYFNFMVFYSICVPFCCICIIWPHFVASCPYFMVFYTILHPFYIFLWLFAAICWLSLTIA